MNQEKLLKKINEAARTGQTELDLSNNNLTSLSAEIGQLKNLTSLRLQNNNLTSWPAEIGQLKNLTTLDLNGNKLTSLPAEIGQLKNLTSLRLQNNNLTSLPAESGQLKNLTELYLQNNNLTSLPAEIGQLEYLAYLDLSDNNLTSLPAEIGQLKNLTELYLGNNNLTSLPTEIGQLKNLTVLWLHDNRLTSLPAEIGQLRNMEELELGGNNLTSLPAEIGQLENLTSLGLEDNPLPETILEMAADYELDDLRTYLQSLIEGKSHKVYQAKLIFVGEGKVGKSSLLAAMKGEEYIEERKTTHGIETCSLNVDHPDIEGGVTLNAWDFGGQEVYRISHQFFYSKQALYLLLWSPRLGVKLCDVAGWIERIKLRVGEDAKIIIVSTYSVSSDRIVRIDQEGLREEYGDMIAGFHEIDSGVNVDGSKIDVNPAGEKVGVSELLETIAKVSGQLPQMGMEMNDSWLNAGEAILKLRLCEDEGGENLPHITLGKFVGICKSHSLKENEAETLAEILHLQGRLVHYSDDPELREEVILQPIWLTKAIGFVLEDARTNEQFGVLEDDRLEEIWYKHSRVDEPCYEPELFEYFLKLMDKYDVSYRLKEPGSSLVTQLVPDARQAKLPEIDSELPNISLVCQMNQSPPGLVPWMIVRTHPFATEPRRHWIDGMYLEHGGHGKALMELHDRELAIKVWGAWPNYFMGNLRYTLEALIADRWPGLEWRLSVPCPHTDKGKACKGRFPLETLYKLKGKNDNIPCMICANAFDIDELLSGFSRNQTLSLEKFTEQLGNIERYVLQNNDILRSNHKILTEWSSKAAAWFNLLLRTIATETKDCPRMYTLLPEKLNSWKEVHIGKEGYRLTLWCEMPGHEHPVCTIGSGKKDNKQCQRGEYIFSQPKEWLVKVAPYISFIARTIKVVVPVAGAAAKVGFDETLLKDMEVMPKLELMEKIADGLPKGALGRASEPDNQLGIINKAEGAGLRALKSLLQGLDKGSTWGGLRRSKLPSKTGEFLWLCEKHYAEHQPEPYKG